MQYSGVALCFLLAVFVANAVQQDPIQPTAEPNPQPLASNTAPKKEGVTESGLLALIKDLKDGEHIEMMYLEAPLSKANYGDTLAAFNLFHGGIGFSIKKKDGAAVKQWAVEYNAQHGVQGALMPMVDGQGKIVLNGGNVQWANAGEVLLLSKIDMTYWTKFTKLADLNKQQYTDTAKFIAGYLSKNKEYKLWQIFSPKNGKLAPSLDSSTCVDFVWRVFQHMTDNLKICLKTNTKPKRVYVTAFDDTKRRELDVSKPRNQKMIQLWYERVAKAVGELSAAAPPGQGASGVMKTLMTKPGAFEQVVQKLSKAFGDVGNTWYFYVNAGNVLQVKLDTKKPMIYQYDNKDEDLFNGPQCSAST